jgi:hypothetical protein
MDPFNWTCPFCNQPTTITKPNHEVGYNNVDLPTKDGPKQIKYLFVACPNPNCKRLVLTVALYEATFANSSYYVTGKLLKEWKLIPSATAKPFPDYIPPPILADYNEACEIRDLSPKASATLCRRCLQGMIRDFWGIAKPKLKQEIDALKDQLDADTWHAIDAVREIGNVGAHMENDVNLIIDVDPGEAQLLIELIETLFESWYIDRNEKQTRNAALKELAEKKKAERKGERADGAI